ncbi:16S rRNA processing protein RimM [Helicobacter didelphidarum]|uniref:Ribosome maturation factor RimM n=1 Tax=Helicobacter didelphidarum TaxID=2040648 RepID=A0A3D8IJR1_9HELI|nr:PRC-barrel domain-containing protein [Helicobacter didelphidarum]RDU64904.1 16S rRNA processing protein RimM [Helicobacter didelphidarum]
MAVGTFGKSVGVCGALRVFLLTDFPEILQRDETFYIDSINTLNDIFLKQTADTIFSKSSIKNHIKFRVHKHTITTNQNIQYIPITLKSYNANNHTIQWKEFTTRQDSDLLRNLTFYSTIETTRELCKLNKDDFFYFDIIGMKVVENGKVLGVVQDIESIGNTHYFILAKNFFIPYIDRYIISVNIDSKEILTRDARFLRM